VTRPFSPQNDGLWAQPSDTVPLTFGQLERESRATTSNGSNGTVTIPQETAAELRSLLLSMADTFTKNDMPDIAIQANAVAKLL
jgi:hypothetical protein